MTDRAYSAAWRAAVTGRLLWQDRCVNGTPVDWRSPPALMASVWAAAHAYDRNGARASHGGLVAALDRLAAFLIASGQAEQREVGALVSPETRALAAQLIAEYDATTQPMAALRWTNDASKKFRVAEHAAKQVALQPHDARPGFTWARLDLGRAPGSRGADRTSTVYTAVRTPADYIFVMCHGDDGIGCVTRRRPEVLIWRYDPTGRYTESALACARLLDDLAMDLPIRRDCSARPYIEPAFCVHLVRHLRRCGDSDVADLALKLMSASRGEVKPPTGIEPPAGAGAARPRARV